METNPTRANGGPVRGDAPLVSGECPYPAVMATRYPDRAIGTVAGVTIIESHDPQASTYAEHMETITDRAEIRATSDERGCCDCRTFDQHERECILPDERTTPAPVGAAVALDLDALHETICDNFTGMAEVRQAADALVAEVRRLAGIEAHRDNLAAMIRRLSEFLDGRGLESWKHGACWAAEDAIKTLIARAESAEAEVGTLRANWRHVTKSLGYGDGVTEPQIGHVEFVAECERQFSEASEWRESQRWRDECHDAGHPDDEDCYEHDPALVLLTLRAKVAAVEAVERGLSEGWVMLATVSDRAEFVRTFRAALATTGEGQ